MVSNGEIAVDIFFLASAAYSQVLSSAGMRGQGEAVQSAWPPLWLCLHSIQFLNGCTIIGAAEMSLLQPVFSWRHLESFSRLQLVVVTSQPPGWLCNLSKTVRLWESGPSYSESFKTHWAGIWTWVSPVLFWGPNKTGRQRCRCAWSLH